MGHEVKRAGNPDTAGNAGFAVAWLRSVNMSLSGSQVSRLASRSTKISLAIPYEPAVTLNGASRVPAEAIEGIIFSATLDGGAADNRGNSKLQNPKCRIRSSTENDWSKLLM